ncbi:MAG: hypothetical protein L3J93_05350 [Thermoplasmata archaeon]|nr:hypothetical protein [Thermoplasmata archaeon]
MRGKKRRYLPSFAALGSVAVLLLILIAGLQVAPPGLTRGPVPFRTAPSVLQRTQSKNLVPPITPGPDCSALLSTATIQLGVAQIYAQLRNQSTVNGSVLVPPSSYPNQGTAVGEVMALWAAICGSPAFVGSIGPWGESNFSSDTEIFDFQWVFTVAISWNQSCTIAPYGAIEGCRYTESWTIFLVSNSYAGPNTAILPPCQSIEKCPSTPVSPRSALPWYGPWTSAPAIGSILALAAGALLGAAILRKRRVARPAAPGGTESPASGGADGAESPSAIDELDDVL